MFPVLKIFSKAKLHPKFSMSFAILIAPEHVLKFIENSDSFNSIFLIVLCICIPARTCVTG